ncbi:MAG: PH domain-containing protein [Actinomycetota bacterium]|nr:PH domain-containing protein [Actinomycetota bacterium]
MSPSQSKRDAVETASRALRERQRAESGQIAAAESALRRRHARPDGAGLPNTAEDSEGAGGRSLAMAETRSVLAELGDRLETDEDALDMAAAVHAGHDGVLVATDRRLMFVAPRRRLSLAYDDVESVHVRGHRWSGTRLTVRSAEGRTTFSAIRPSHARELAELVRGRTHAPAG